MQWTSVYKISKDYLPLPGRVGIWFLYEIYYTDKSAFKGYFAYVTIFSLPNSTKKSTFLGKYSVSWALRRQNTVVGFFFKN